MTGEKKYPQRELRVFSFIAIPDVTVFAFALGGHGYPSLALKGLDPVGDRQKPEKSKSEAPVERREQPRGAANSTDWETIVLKRVERHVESLSADPGSPLDPPNACGWEEAALLALQRRIRDFRAK